jgi:hypothetical protein
MEGSAAEGKAAAARQGGPFVRIAILFLILRRHPHLEAREDAATTENVAGITFSRA